MDFNESRTIPGFNEYELVQIRDVEPSCVGPCYFVLFTFLMGAQFYKSYVDKFCIVQNYKIRKIISTRYNLLAPQYVQMYAPMAPALNLGK